MKNPMNEGPVRGPRQTWGSYGFFSIDFADAFEDIRSYREYIKLISSEIAKREIAFEKQLDTTAQNSGWNEEEISCYYEAHREQWEDLAHTFPAILRRTLFTTLFSLLESRLIVICKDLDNDLRHSPEIRWECASERGIEKARAYLGKAFHINIAKCQHWERLKCYGLIRNCILHADSKPHLMNATARDRLGKAIKKHRELDIALPDLESGIETIQLTETTLRQQADDIQHFFQQLLDAFQKDTTIGPKYWP